MLRTALRPRWLALLALALALATVFAWLGNWQLGRSRDQAADGPAPTGTVRLQDVVEPQTPFTGELVDRTVEVSGVMGAQTLLVEGRLLDGAAGGWLLNPVVVETGSGPATLPVVRGWVPEGADVPPAPAGDVTLTGRLEPSEAPTGEVTSTTVTTVSSADLVNRWGQPIYTGFLVTDDPLPADGVRAIPAVPVDDGGFALQNLSYALQWWVFALFAVFLWWRVVRDAYVEGRAAAQEPVVNNGMDVPEQDPARPGRGAPS